MCVHSVSLGICFGFSNMLLSEKRSAVQAKDAEHSKLPSVLKYMLTFQVLHCINRYLEAV